MNRLRLSLFLRLSLVLASSLSIIHLGCHSPYYADRGAGFGALAGAGTGAIIGNATGNTGAGAAIGAGIGALTGAAVGQGMDEMAAQNRAQIAAQLGRPVHGGAATTDEVIAMSRAGVEPQLIKNYIRTSGVTAPLSADQVIQLHNQGVATDVIQVLQTPAPHAMAAIPSVGPTGPTTIIEEHYYGPPPFPRPYCGPHRVYSPRRHLHWGVSVSN